MTVHRARILSLYFLIALNLFMLVAGLSLTLYVAHLREQVQETRAYQERACERGNFLRLVVRHLIKESDDPNLTLLLANPLSRTIDCP